MQSSIRGFTAVSILAIITLSSATAFAQEDASQSSLSVSANAAMTSEYRFRGVDLSGGKFAIQGGVDADHDSGIYVGTWASSLDETSVGFGSTELDIYGGWRSEISDRLSLNIGVIHYMYPDAGAGNFDYTEFYGAVGFAFGPAAATVGLAYAPDQASLGNTDNTYVYTDISVGIPDTPLTVTGHVGYTDGFLTYTNDSKAIDWSIGAETAIAGTPLTFGVAYTGVEGDIIAPSYDFADDAFVVTLSASL